MAWSRLWTAGAEAQDVNEFVIHAGGINAPTLSSTKARTGTYSWRGETTTAAIGRTFASTTQIRAGYWINHNGIAANAEPALFSWMNDTNWRVEWDGATAVLGLWLDNVLKDSVAPGTYNFGNTDTWHHLGLVLYGHASAGWVSFYINGVKALTATGEDTNGAITQLYMGGRQHTTQTGFAQYAYVDDMYIDTGGGSEPDAAPELHRFGWIIANGNGSNSDLTGSDGNQVNNFEQVDDVPEDGDTTYNEGASSGLQDSYAMTTVTTPNDYNISAVIPSPSCKRLGATETLKLLLDDGAANQSLGAEQAPAADYDYVQERFTTQPAGGAWDQSAVDDIEVGIETAGTY